MVNDILFIQGNEFNSEHYVEYINSQVINKYKDDECEINLYIATNKTSLIVEPPESLDAIKTYYIIQGSCRHIESNKILGVGDIFVLKSSMGMNSFIMLEDTKILVHANNFDAYGRILSNTKKMASILEQIQNKDCYTKEHCDRVFKLCQRMALICGYKAERYVNMTIASRYHDIGKIYIDDDILNKPGLLNEEEFGVMRQHVNLGKEFLLSIYDDIVIDIIAQHHERIDGSGYPKGLKNDEIMEEARILAICDSFDAMITDRVYKKGKSIEVALIELKSLAGSKYDEKLVDMFVHMINDEIKHHGHI